MATRDASELGGRPLSYDLEGVTSPGSTTWRPYAPGYRTFEVTKRIAAPGDWLALADAVKHWHVKTHSGFIVNPATAARSGSSYWLQARVGPLRVHEPVRVVAEVSDPTRVGFAYGTLVGHPVSGEEAFIVHRTDEGVFLTLRSVTRHGAGLWRLAFPAVLLAQRLYRRRYLRALQH